MNPLKTFLLNPNFTLYFAILVLVGDVLDVALTLNIRITQPIDFYSFEQNIFFKEYVGTDLWFIPIIISLSFSLLLIFLAIIFPDLMIRAGLTYFGFFTYVYSISWIIGYKLYLYYHLIFMIVFAISFIIELKNIKRVKNPSID